MHYLQRVKFGKNVKLGDCCCPLLVSFEIDSYQALVPVLGGKDDNDDPKNNFMRWKMFRGLIKEGIFEMDGGRLKIQLINVSLNKNGSPNWLPVFRLRKLLDVESVPGLTMMSCSGFNQSV